MATRVWDAKVFTLIAELPLELIDAAFSSDGTLVIGHTFATLEAWDWRANSRLWSVTEPTDRGEVETPELPEMARHSNWSGFSYPTHGLAVSPNGEYVASYSASQDSNVRLWRVATGELVETFTGHTDAITVIGFTPDGSKLAAASRDQTILVWAVP